MPKRSGIENGPQLTNSERSPQLQARLQEIISQPLTPTNSATYFDDALTDLTGLIDRITQDYRQSHPDETTRGAELEDKAFEYFKLQSIPEILSVISEGKEVMDIISARVSDLAQDHATYVPPDAQLPRFGQGGGNAEKAGIQGRLRTLLYVLKTEGISIEDNTQVSLIQGSVTDRMVRRMGYAKVDIPERNRIFLVCDEEGNASYAFDRTRLMDSVENIDSIVDYTKEDLRDLIRVHPGIGIRFEHSTKWADRVREFLSIDFSTEIPTPNRLNALRMLPQVSLAELDPWRGFWTDPVTGKHWSTDYQLALRLGIFSGTLHRRIDAAKITLEHREVRDKVGRAQSMMAFEDVSPLFADHASVPMIALEGAWMNFWTDPETGKHYGSKNEIIRRLNTERPGNVFTKSVLTHGLGQLSNPLAQKTVLDYRKSSQLMYAYEDVRTIFEHYLSAPELYPEGDPEWEGFYLDKEGARWGTLTVIKDKLERDGFSSPSITSIHKRIRSRPLKTVFITNVGHTGYRYEEIRPLYEHRARAPRVDLEGKWKGFVTLEDGRHRSTLFRIQEWIESQYGISNSIFHKETQDLLPSLSSEPILDLHNRKNAGYVLEEIMPLFENKVLLPQVDFQGEWEGFLSSDGKHYGTISMCVKRLVKIWQERTGENIPERRVASHIRRLEIEETEVPTKELRDVSGRDRIGYSFEDVERLYFARFPTG